MDIITSVGYPFNAHTEDDDDDEDEDEDDNDDSDEKVCHFTNFLMISIISCLNRIESNYLYVSGIAFLYDGMK